MHRWALLAAAFACVARVDAQTKCADLGIDVPSVVTVVASPTNVDEALVVQPDCREISIESLSLFAETLSFREKIERVDSVPGSARSYEFTGCPLSAGFDLSAATDNVGAVFISGASATAFRNSIYPRSVNSVSIISTPIESLDTTTFPSSLQSLSIRTTQLRTLPQLPSSLTSLSCTNSKLQSIAGVSWPSTLTDLDLTGNLITALDKIILPSRLRSFTCANCELTLIRGVKLPATLTSLSLGGKVKEFEIRASDATVLERLIASAFDTSAFTTKCSDSTNKPRLIGRFKVCVISDKRFNQLYGEGGGVTDSSLSSTTSSASTSSSTATSASSDSPQGSNTSGNSNGGIGSSDVNGGSGVNSDSLRGSSTSPDDPMDGGGVSDGNTTASASSSSTTIIVVIVSACITTILALVGFRVLSRRRSESDKGDKEFQALRTSINASENLTVTTGNGSHPSINSGATIDTLKRDIRRDPTLIAHRIDLRLLKLGKQIARGGFGVIYKAEYNDQVVAIKRLAPESVEDDAKVYRFMDEIRMCATMNHPKIVTFIGVVWSTLRDISVVIELMEGGDLCEFLLKQPVPASPKDWFEPWTATKTTKSKLLIARDVVEAVVYLHSFDTPIVHRDLKARNVLLDSQGNAKLSDFGISRERTLDETMTGGVGTAAWIAPEVLCGDRYSEKADIYSLGVLLVELDRCRHTYADDSEIVNASTSGTDLACKDARIVMLVGSGQLRPQVSADSPSSVRELVDRCLQLQPGDRPSAAEVLQYLNQIGRA